MIWTPKLLWNCWILLNYAGAAAWWLFHGKPWDAGYWCAAFAITFIVTFGYSH